MLTFQNKLVITPILVMFLISGCRQNEPATQVPIVTAFPSPSSISDLDFDSALISDLFYQDQIAASKSMQDLFDFQIANTYPGVLNVDVATANFSKVGQIIPYGVPDLSTLRLDPKWVVPVICDADIDLGEPPVGTTYIVAAESEYGLSQVHVTILDGKAYYYPGFCLD